MSNEADLVRLAARVDHIREELEVALVIAKDLFEASKSTEAEPGCLAMKELAGTLDSMCCQLEEFPGEEIGKALDEALIYLGSLAEKPNQ